jgi:subtilisin family serine protease
LGKFQGFVARATDAYIEYLRNHNLIESIEPDMFVHSNRGDDDPLCLIQRNATWGLNRVSERNIDLDGTYHYDHNGQGVDVYIVDTGISTTHEEFRTANGSRAVWGMNFADRTDRDCNGHGTHVAGTIGGKSYGLAKDVNLIAVKVLDCEGSGSNSGVIKGMEWVVAQRRATRRPSVVNMSLGGSFSSMVNQAVASLHQAGVTVVVAAGNEDTDACSGSPSSSKDAITVGATAIESAWDGTQSDHRSYFSNYGTCVDIFAPGSGITSTWIGSDSAKKTISGTSMASPHVAGAAALYLSYNPLANPEQVREYLTTQATQNAIVLACKASSCERSPNKLLFSSC